MTEFSIAEESHGQRGISIAVRGEVDIATAPEMHAALTAASARCPKGGAVTVDLTSVTFMDSSGLRALLASHRLAAESGVRLVVAADRPPVTRLFELTRVADELEVVGDPAAALGPGPD